MIKQNIDGLTQTFNNLIFAYNDHQYLTLSYGDILRAAFLDRNQVFFHRLKFYLLHFTIIEMYKLLGPKEKYCIRYFVDEAMKNPKYKIHENKLIEISNKLYSIKIKDLVDRLTKLRNQAAAHLTGKHKALKGTKILTAEIEYSLKIINELLRILYAVEFSTQYEIPIKSENLGYKLH